MLGQITRVEFTITELDNSVFIDVPTACVTETVGIVMVCVGVPLIAGGVEPETLLAMITPNAPAS